MTEMSMTKINHLNMKMTWNSNNSQFEKNVCL